MDVTQLNAVVYVLQRQMGSLEPWANSVNAALQDHARHIDHRGATADAQRKHLVQIQESIDKGRISHDALKEDLTKVVIDLTVNDDALKAKLETAFAELPGMVKELQSHCDNSVAELNTSATQAVDPKLASLEARLSAVAIGTPAGAAHAICPSKFVEMEAVATGKLSLGLLWAILAALGPI